MVRNKTRRIISLVPSLSETLVAMGLEDSVVGITTFCVHPSDLHRHATIVGGTKDPDLQKIIALKPTHIIANKEENRKEDIEYLMLHAPVLLTDTSSLAEVPDLIRSLMDFLELSESPLDVLWFQEQLLFLQAQNHPRTPALYLIWSNPYMAAGKDTYISSAMKLLGYDNIVAQNRYPEVRLQDYQYQNIEILLSSEPYPFRKRDAACIRNLVANEPILRKIDGKIMSWYGASSFELLTKISAHITQDWRALTTSLLEL